VGRLAEAIKLTAKVKGKTIDELKEEQSDLKSLLNKIVLKFRAGEEVDDYLLESLPDMKERLAYLNRVVKSHDSTLHFMYEYFSDDLNPDNEGNIIPAGIGIDDAPEFHELLTENLNVLSSEAITK
jgi:hypothetical protein